MNTESILQIKIECVRIVVEKNKAKNRSIELVLKEANDLFNWVVKSV